MLGQMLNQGSDLICTISEFQENDSRLTNLTALCWGLKATWPQYLFDISVSGSSCIEQKVQIKQSLNGLKSLNCKANKELNKFPSHEWAKLYF